MNAAIDLQAQRLPAPTHRIAVPMRDGVRLDTAIWLPSEPLAPAILIRTPYSRSLNVGGEPVLLRYLTAGYAVVLQQIRGIGRSEGRFTFNSPLDRTDGYDTVEWIAAQPWCTGAVGMDGHSYAGMTQLTTAVARPPHLRCIVPAVASLDFFREPPYLGGAFSRMHTLVWARALQFDSLLDEAAGNFELHGFMTRPELLARWTSRPLTAAVEGELTGDTRAHYLDSLAHSTFDDWWRERTLGPAEYASIDVPTLVVTGNFDPSTGPLTLWRGLEAHGAHPDRRQLLIGPWDHNACYVGGRRRHGPYDLGDGALPDVVGLRLAFFDRHLKGEGDGPPLANRVTVFLTGANEWRTFDSFPPREIVRRELHLSSGGHANSSRGDGRLVDAVPPAGTPPDTFVDDPEWPFVAGLTLAKGYEHALDMRERERSHDTLVYCTGALARPLMLLGEAELDLHVTVDAPDADFCAWLVEHTPDGSSTFLALGQLRLRYRDGFESERPIAAGDTARLRFPLTYVGHRVPAGHSLRLLISGSNFPLVDPNPHVAGPIASATAMRTAVQTVFHDAARPSRLVLPVLE